MPENLPDPASKPDLDPAGDKPQSTDRKRDQTLAETIADKADDLLRSIRSD